MESKTKKMPEEVKEALRLLGKRADENNAKSEQLERFASELTTSILCSVGIEKSLVEELMAEAQSVSLENAKRSSCVQAKILQAVSRSGADLEMALKASKAFREYFKCLEQHNLAGEMTDLSLKARIECGVTE